VSNLANQKYTGTASFEKISQAFPRPLPQSPLVFFPALSLALFFARAPLSERLEQASTSQNQKRCKGSLSGKERIGRCQRKESSKFLSSAVGEEWKTESIHLVRGHALQIP